MRNRLILLFIIWLIGLATILILRMLTQPFTSFIYWAILGLFISTVWLFKLKSPLVLFLSFGLFISAGILTAFKVYSIAEMIIRISLIGWLVGFVQSVFEYFSNKPQ